MKSFIEELYFGDIDAQKRVFKADGLYEKSVGVINENEKLLTKILEGEELRLFLDFLNAWEELMGAASCEAFTNGFRLGAAFALDAFASGY